MIRAICTLFAAALLLPAGGTLAAQATAASPSPTLPSDTLQANYAPRSAPGPMPELAPSLPSDTLEATQPVDSFPTGSPGADSRQSDSLQNEPFDQAAPVTPGDSAAVRDLRSWIRLNPGPAAPPPIRAVLVQV